MQQNDHEHRSFEEFAKEKGLDNEMHPLHLLYLNSKTSTALEAFKAGYAAAKHFNNLDPAQLERVAVLFEECGEVIQVCGKIVRHGFDSRHPDGGEDNRRLLEKELGDLKLAEIMMANRGDISRDAIMVATTEKNARIGPYLHHQES